MNLNFEQINSDKLQEVIRNRLSIRFLDTKGIYWPIQLLLSDSEVNGLQPEAVRGKEDSDGWVET